MRMFYLLCVFSGLCAIGAGQSAKLPSDINADTLTRLPPVQRAELDEGGRTIFEALSGGGASRGGARPLRGILGLAIYNPKLAESLHLLHDSVIKDGTLGARVNELAILVATREEDMSMNEWYGHEATALTAGVEPSVIEVIREGKSLDGIAEKDAVVIRFGRELFRNKHVSQETFAKAVELFGRRGTVEMIGVMGDYAMVGMMLQAVDQQLPGKTPLPPLKVR